MYTGWGMISEQKYIFSAEQNSSMHSDEKNSPDSHTPVTDCNLLIKAKNVWVLPNQSSICLETSF